MKRKLLLVLVVLTTIMISCSKDDSVNAELKLDKQELKVTSQSQTIAYKFHSAKEWQALSNSNWIKLDKKDGKGGDNVLNLSIDENTSGIERNSSFVLISDEIREEIKVTQSQNNILSASKLEFEVGSMGGEVSVEIESNLDYDIVMPADCDWVSLVTTKAIITATHSFIVQENTVEEERLAEIVVKSKTTDDQCIIKIKQEKYVPPFHININDIKTTKIKGDVEPTFDGTYLFEILNEEEFSSFAKEDKPEELDTLALITSNIDYCKDNYTYEGDCENWTDLLKKYLLKGKTSFTEDDYKSLLHWGHEYYIYAFKIDENGEYEISSFIVKKVKMQDNKVDASLKLDIHVLDVYTVDQTPPTDAVVKPSNSTCKYFLTVQKDRYLDFYLGDNDKNLDINDMAYDLLRARMADSTPEQFASYFHKGDYTLQKNDFSICKHFSWKLNSYYVIAFCVDENNTLCSEVAYKKFTYAKK